MDNNIEKIFSNLYKDLNDFTSLIIKSLYIKYNYLNNELKYHYLKKPSKIFKNKYKDWLKEENIIKEQINEVLKNIEFELNNK